MPDELISIDTRVDAALGAMAAPPFVASDVATRVAARAILAGVPAARASHRMMRIAALLAVVAVGAATLSVSHAPARPTVRAPMPDAIASVTPARIIPAMAVSARPIVFELDAPSAHSVQVLGDFNQWSRTGIAMERGADGRWRITTMLPPGRYVYTFLVDGRRFRSDPARDAVEDRDFGVTGSELVVGDAP